MANAGRVGATRRRGPVRRAPVDVVGIGLLVVGVELVGLSVLMFVSPATFFDEIAPYGVRNDHYLVDGATFQIALGFGALVAARRPAWRVPVAAMLAFQFSLHTINHGIDAGEADPAWLGLANVIVLAAGSLLLVWLLARAVREEGTRR